jgi:hypothetical protein
MRTNKIGLRNNLFNIGLANSPVCRKCNREDEKLHHIIYSCPGLVRERLNLWRSLGGPVENMSDLLGDPGKAAVTAKFVLETGLVTDFRGFSLQEPITLNREYS